MTTPRVSLIIPTYNRPDVLARTLVAAGKQTLAADQYEIIVVDDGSAESICTVVTTSGLPNARCMRQVNQGATVARNTGAQAALGELLVFLDDDICLQPQTLAELAASIAQWPDCLIMGRLIWPPTMERSIYAQALRQTKSAEPLERSDLPYVYCQTGLLAVRREAFMTLGMFQDPTGGWPNWDDVDFGYRAQQMGLALRRNPRAVGEHWDYSLQDIDASSHRWYRASYAAATLFERYPQMQTDLPMFRDMTPIVWGEDTLGLIVRKVARRLLSIRPMVWSMEKITALLEKHFPTSRLLRPLYRWINGSAIYNGYRAGLRDKRLAIS
ncbi:MAG: glycosyltransferase [Anaerolineae bacterium]|nr:glycosyltransferase [Anaerolineae bacterium]